MITRIEPEKRKEKLNVAVYCRVSTGSDIQLLSCDHASGLIPLKDAKHIYCSEEEWRHAQGKGDVRYNSSFWEGIHMETLPMKKNKRAPFGKSCDLFGDRSIHVILTPGHSEGSVAVLAKGETGYAAFIGDDSYNRHSWEELKLP